MNFESILEHHLLDHSYFKMFSAGPVDFHLSKHLAVMWGVAALVIAVLSAAARGKSGAGLVLRGGVETVVLYIRDHMLHPIFHDATETYLPYFLTLFFFIFTCNIVGLIPEAAAVTSNISVTLALALCTFMLIQFAGVKEQGAVSYVAHICPGGLPAWLVPLVFVIEIAGMLAKTVSLCIRLFANILAGHIVSLAFLCMIFIFGALSPLIGLGVAPAAVGLALFVYTLDVLVALLQAYIFTFLTALFVGGPCTPTRRSQRPSSGRPNKKTLEDLKMDYLGLAYIGVAVGMGLCLIGGALGISSWPAPPGRRRPPAGSRRRAADDDDHPGRHDRRLGPLGPGHRADGRARPQQGHPGRRGRRRSPGRRARRTLNDRLPPCAVRRGPRF